MPGWWPAQLRWRYPVVVRGFVFRCAVATSAVAAGTCVVPRVGADDVAHAAAIFIDDGLADVRASVHDDRPAG